MKGIWVRGDTVEGILGGMRGYGRVKRDEGIGVRRGDIGSGIVVREYARDHMFEGIRVMRGDIGEGIGERVYGHRGEQRG